MCWWNPSRPLRRNGRHGDPPIPFSRWIACISLVYRHRPGGIPSRDSYSPNSRRWQNDCEEMVTDEEACAYHGHYRTRWIGFGRISNRKRKRSPWHHRSVAMEDPEHRLWRFCLYEINYTFTQPRWKACRISIVSYTLSLRTSVTI